MDDTTRTMICITCPKGCALQVTANGSTLVKAVGGCKRGHEYAERELTDPRRMVATTVQIEKSLHPLMPVYTTAAFPKSRIPELLTELKKIRLTAPIRMGSIILKDALGCGVDVVASRSAEIYSE